MEPAKLDENHRQHPFWRANCGTTGKTCGPRYVARYLKSYGDEGVGIQAVTVQNEPAAALRRGKAASIPAEDEAELIRDHLAPVFEQEGLKTKIIIWDHNKERVYERARDTLRDPAVRGKRCGGIGFHWYSRRPIMTGWPWPMKRSPKRNLIATEFCYGMTRKNDWGLGVCPGYPAQHE